MLAGQQVVRLIILLRLGANLIKYTILPQVPTTD